MAGMDIVGRSLSIETSAQDFPIDTWFIAQILQWLAPAVSLYSCLASSHAVQEESPGAVANFPGSHSWHDNAPDELDHPDGQFKHWCVGGSSPMVPASQGSDFKQVLF